MADHGTWTKWRQGCKCEHCKDVRNSNDKNTRERNIRVVNAIKDTPCADCEQKFPPYVMQFDHVRGEKKANVGNLVSGSRSLAKIFEEIEKCEIVCANCHAIRTYERSH